jgi:cell wall assembly regulator SMI1
MPAIALILYIFGITRNIYVYLVWIFLSTFLQTWSKMASKLSSNPLLAASGVVLGSEVTHIVISYLRCQPDVLYCSLASKAWATECRGDIWATFCKRDFGINPNEDLESPNVHPADSRSALVARKSFMELWASWKRMSRSVGSYENVDTMLSEGFTAPGFLRVARLWRRLEQWTAQNCKSVRDTLAPGTDKMTMELAGATVNEVLIPEVGEGGWFDSVSRLVWAVHDGQIITSNEQALCGLIGGFSFYDSLFCVKLLSLKQAAEMTEQLRKQFRGDGHRPGMSQFPHHLCIAQVSPSLPYACNLSHVHSVLVDTPLRTSKQTSFSSSTAPPMAMAKYTSQYTVGRMGRSIKCA